ncbi:MAG: arsenate reductase ArsC [Bacteroidetes bacterium]|nr:arsenate reductase ArsC [Bacteroidota bacterium]MCL5737423.1 arsenate reductase ArsC [Bacteroidota bacterium]
MDKIKVLFICVHNSARSQMAEVFLNKYGGKHFVAESAGLEPGKLNPIVVDAMKEIGIDISSNKTKSVFDFYKEGRMFNYAITVCDESNAERCPIFPGVTERLHWSFKDPSALTGSYEDKLAGVRIIRDQIKDRIQEWLKEFAINSIGA